MERYSPSTNNAIIAGNDPVTRAAGTSAVAAPGSGPCCGWTDACIWRVDRGGRIGARLNRVAADQEWFPFRSGGDDVFAATARELAPERLGDLVAPSDTWGVSLAGPFLAVELPDVRRGRKGPPQVLLQVPWLRGVLGG